MPVHVNELVTEIMSDDDVEAPAAAESGAPEAGWPVEDQLRAAHERLIRDRLRTRAEDFSD